MRQPSDTALLTALVQTFNKEVQDFWYFPEVFLAGRHRLDATVFHLLQQQGLLQQVAADSFGRTYRLSAAAEAMLINRLHKPRRVRKPAAVGPALSSTLPLYPLCY